MREPPVCATCGGSRFVLPCLYPARQSDAIWGSGDASRQLAQKPRRCPMCNAEQPVFRWEDVPRFPVSRNPAGDERPRKERGPSS